MVSPVDLGWSPKNSSLAINKDTRASHRDQTDQRPEQYALAVGQ